MDQPLINILTRTSSRPIFFAKCHESIMSQTYQNIRHIVSVDNEDTYKYVKSYNYPETNIVKINRQFRHHRNHMPYNLYCNHLIHRVIDGWVMFLDDDDMFVNNKVLESVVKYINSVPKINLWVWKTNLNKTRVVPSTSFGKKITIGDISSTSVLFHNRVSRLGWWDDRQASDGRYFVKLYRHPNTVVGWIPKIFTQIILTSGFGLQRDLPETKMKLELQA
jgi:glycosyltransferase involved in cell wall biosynthesis